MKPPPRQRTQTVLCRKAASTPQRWSQWSRSEQRSLLRALGKLDRDRELDYQSLVKGLPSRSCSEVTAAVESLKDKVIALASSELKKKRWEKKSDRKPIETWTLLASTLTGANQEPVSKAFAQVFLISSLEPRTLSSSERPRRVSDSQPAHTAPPTLLPCSAVLSVPNGKVPRPQQRPLTPGGESVTPASAVLAPPAATAVPSPTAAVPSPSTAAAPSPSAAPQAAAAAADAEPKDAPSSTSAEASTSVDFEKIYNFLCAVQKPNKAMKLTAMEGAIVLDLLMSLPEELQYLKCKKLQEHLNQVFQFLTSPSDCSDPTELLRSLREVAGGQQAAAASRPQSEKPAGDDTDSRGSGKQPGGAAVVYPPLNPFLVPPQLLMRK